MKISFIIVLFFTFINAQYPGNFISGQISGLLLNDETSTPVEYATISIFKKDKNSSSNEELLVTGGISDEDGYFSIIDIKPGRYNIVIKFTGYESIKKNNIKLIPPQMKNDLGTIRLIPKNLTLDEITVAEKKTFIENKIDKKVYNVGDEASTTGGSASDVLEQIPSITIDVDGNIQLRQDSNVTILINGRQSNFGNNIDMLGADMIDRVEVITTPSAKYDPDGTAGIINIILSKNEYVGSSGNVKLHYGQRNSFGISGSINYLKNDWNIFTNYNLNSKNKLGSGFRETMTYDESGNFLEDLSSVTNSVTNRHPKNLNIKIGVENYLSDSQTLAFDATVFKKQGIDSTNASTYRFDTDSYINTKEVEDENSNDITVGLGYFNDLNDNEELSVQFDMDNSKDYDKKTDFQLDQNYISISDNEGDNKTLSIDYNRPIKNKYNNEDSKLEFGLKIISSEDIKNQDYNSSPFYYNYEQSRTSAYVNTSYYFTESFGIQGGLRFEKSNTNSLLNGENLNLSEPSNIFEWSLVELGDNITDYEYNYDRIYPSLFLLYNLKDKGDIKFEFGRRINRPGFWSTNPFPDIDYEQNWIRQGNPYLRPEDIYKCELSYSVRTPIGFLSTSVYYSETTDLIDRHKYIKEYDGEPYSILTWVNKGKTQDSGLEFMFMTKPLPFWRFMISGNFWYNNTIEAQDEDMKGIESGFWGFSKSTFSLKNNQEIQLTGKFSSTMKVTTGEILPIKSLDFAYKKEVDDKFNITLKIKDVFDSGGWHILTDQNQEIDGNTINQLMDAKFRRNNRTISISLEYKFGEFKKKKYIRDDSRNFDFGGDGGMDAGY